MSYSLITKHALLSLDYLSNLNEKISNIFLFCLINIFPILFGTLAARLLNSLKNFHFSIRVRLKSKTGPLLVPLQCLSVCLSIYQSIVSRKLNKIKT